MMDGRASAGPVAPHEGTRVRRRILVRGLVQGVGFRPFVHRRATALGLAGWVGNTGDGVAVEAEGEGGRIEALIEAIAHEPPKHALVDSLASADIAPQGQAGFAIRASEADAAARCRILPDIATCPDCLAELFDPADRRHRYPFIACTQCGPRYSIVEDLPYDRDRTSMRLFPLCPTCRAEYENPADRRFHAEATGCPRCGPRLALWSERGEALARDQDALAGAAEAVRAGRILAMKGIGGFHLIADARNEDAARALRARKNRPDKPFAVMFPTLEAAREACDIFDAEATLLADPARPIVLVRRACDALAAAVAPGNPWLGAILPYSPMHHLLLCELGSPVVATSGNRGDEPICIDERDALERLRGIADLFLVHDRPIRRPVEDSIACVIDGHASILRLGRGYAPATISAPGIEPGVAAVGGHLKASVAVTRPGAIVLGGHLGDLDSVAARASHAAALADLERLHPEMPRRVARDLHPDYASTRLAETLGREIVPVQHHLAHTLACMAENGVAAPVLGVAWDGTGYGTDGTIWGGEFLAVDADGWRRVAHLRTFPLPGGEAAAREPRRSALGLLFAAFGESALERTDLAPVADFDTAERRILRAMLTRGVNTPMTSSVGRLFDAFAALIGLRQRASYEGQAAAELEWAAEGYESDAPYEFPLREAAAGELLLLDWEPALRAALADIAAGRGSGIVSARLHAGLAAAIVALAERMAIPRVALIGGCFQNRRLAEAAARGLRAAGFKPLLHRRIPCNDGGLALGQAAWAARTGDPPCA